MGNKMKPITLLYRTPGQVAEWGLHPHVQTIYAVDISPEGKITHVSKGGREVVCSWTTSFYTHYRSFDDAHADLLSKCEAAADVAWARRVQAENELQWVKDNRVSIDTDNMEMKHAQG